MKILNISCHETLERIETKIFRELGHEVTVIGFDMTKNSSEFNLVFELLNSKYILPNIHPQSGHCILSDTLVEGHDLIINNHYPLNLIDNLSVLKNKKVIIRSIGMPNPDLDRWYDNFVAINPQTKIVRMSELESPRDYLVTQCYEEKLEWIGNIPKVLTVRKLFKKRRYEQCFDIYEDITNGFDVTLIGSGNEDIPYSRTVSDQELIELYSNHAVYFYPPNLSSFVTFSLIEAMSAGIPIVTINIANSPPKLIEHNYNGLIANSVDEAKNYINQLISNKSMAQELGSKARQTVVPYSYENIKLQWQKILES